MRSRLWPLSGPTKWTPTALRLQLLVLSDLNDQLDKADVRRHPILPGHKGGCFNGAIRAVRKVPVWIACAYSLDWILSSTVS